MTNIQRTSCLAMIALLLLAAVGEAKTRQEYLRESDRLMSRGLYDEALQRVQEGSRLYVGDIDLTVAQAEIQYFNRDYLGAVASYIKIIDALARSREQDRDLALYHGDLIRAYIRLGNQHLFSQELCLRVIYHQEKIFELRPQTADEQHSLTTLYGIMDYYEMAEAGAKLIKTGGSGDDVILPDDYITDAEKQRYLNRARKRLSRFY